MAVSRTLFLALAAATLLVCLAPSFSAAVPLTYNQEMVLAQRAILRTPGYTLFAKNFKNISSITAKFSRQLRNPPVTVLAPSDPAVMKALSFLSPNQKSITAVVQYHVIRGVVSLPRLMALVPGTKLATFNLGKFLLKASPVNRRPITLRSPRSPVQAVIGKQIFLGRYIAVYGVNNVLRP